ncbi:DUF2845 domain-containing protein [Halopseudomonas maritima]|uniref:DUF2845 domain-containing protein n=1 Tax=Halopseudomonas maritima TaxID=2918528 RepID=UPI001EEBD220|nr:DUF2845 domain-containing protein [Halopseudomonas maritima]UJJ30407.1 DUF2845 domain-containing protein [Halopseudomonas maritima]
MSVKNLMVMLVTLVTATASQAATMRCAGGIIATGALQAEVLEQCGEPDSRRLTPRHIDPDGYPAEGSVTVEHWAYGPSNGMVRELRFIDGRLVHIDSSRR